ncbi:MAG: ABC transporter ATP-binding protein, partial [Phycisphaerales bacterium]|nr:ABC transporter ATP-binding protein [Phycisphaerales bacterium]
MTDHDITQDAVVTIDDVHRHFRLDDETIRAVDGVSTTIARGEFLAIMGHSGSGKTTLMHLIGGLDLPDRGRIVVDGHEINAMSDTDRTLYRRRHLGVVFQAFNLLPTLSALENVMLPYLVDGRSASEARRRATELLESVQLGHRMKHRPALMSGGEQQRVAIARALMVDPVLILADEPTGNLDPSSSKQIWNLLRSLCETSKTTVIMVTHEALAAAHADRVLFLKSGRLSGDAHAEGAGDAKLVADRYAQLA